MINHTKFRKSIHNSASTVGCRLEPKRANIIATAFCQDAQDNHIIIELLKPEVASFNIILLAIRLIWVLGVKPLFSQSKV